MRNIRDSKGFTLIELMIVVVIIGILAAIAIPKFSGASKQARQSEAESILKQMYTLENTHWEKYGAYTSALDATGLARVGWEAPAAKYFTFSVVAGASATEACLLASPLATATTQVESRSMKIDRVTDPATTNDRKIYPTADCSGTAL